MAPSKWYNMSREVLDQYVLNIENRWPVLHLYDNHWKVNAIMTSIYSQWYKRYHKKMVATGEKNKGEEQVQKRAKINNKDDKLDNDNDNDDCEDEDKDKSSSNNNSEGTPTPEPLVDTNPAQSSQIMDDNQGGHNLGTSRPKARLLILTDPL
jgi:hypothetical protein